MYYRLNDNVMLRGWKGRPFGLAEKRSGRARFFRKAEFRLILDCDGQTDIDLDALDDDARNLIDYLEKNEAIHRCDEPESMLPEQSYKTYPNRYMESAIVSITGLCNYRCRHCFMSAPTGEHGQLSFDELCRLNSQLAECGVRNVELTGGEALVRKDFWDVVDDMQAKGLQVVTLYTNGRLLTDAVLEGFEKRNMRPGIVISFDGVDGWHNWMRGMENAEEEAYAAFECCRRHGFPCSVETVIHKGSLSTVRETVRKLADLGVSGIKINAVDSMGEWEHGSCSQQNANQDLTPKEAFDFYLDYIPQYFEDGAPISISLEGLFKNTKGKRDWEVRGAEDPKLIREVKENIGRQYLCESMRMTVSVDARGRLVPCMSLAYQKIAERYPNILEEGLAAALSSDEGAYWRSIDARIDEYLEHRPECKDCTYLYACGSGCRAEAIDENSTDFFAIDQRMCDFFKGGYMEKMVAVAQACAPKDQDNE